MSKVYLVTSEDMDIQWGVSLVVEGVFDSNIKALDYIASRTSSDEFEITPMTVNLPESDMPKDKEYGFFPYPLVHYEE